MVFGTETRITRIQMTEVKVSLPDDKPICIQMSCRDCGLIHSFFIELQKDSLGADYFCSQCDSCLFSVFSTEHPMGIAIKALHELKPQEEKIQVCYK